MKAGNLTFGELKSHENSAFSPYGDPPALLPDKLLARKGTG